MTQAKNWYAQQTWLVGANFLPSTAINELEMWQAATFDTLTISKEFAWATAIGMNTMRIFLHDLAYQQDPVGFMKRIDIILTLAKRYGIKPMFVLFDSVWDPFPHTGKQHEPGPFLHNSGWVQSPGADALKDTTQYARLKKYVTDIVAHFANDTRILAWDVWNEPDNTNSNSYNRFEPYNKEALVESLLAKAFIWARSANPIQPLTSGVWKHNWASDTSITALEKIQLYQSDVISFHSYEDGATFEKRILSLKRFNRPILCTEYMARGNGSTFQSTLPIAKKYNVAAINWGLVSGKSQTIYPWDSWSKKYTQEPNLWHHDVFRKNGTAYKKEEVDFIMAQTNRQKNL
ncbi:MAG: 1,4-beta-xylanase [Flavitalea sp.]